MRIFYVASLLLILCSCEKTDKRDEVEFDGATFGFVSKSKTTLETTLHSREIYMKPPGTSDVKVLVGYGSQELDIFPIDKRVLTGVEYTIVDTTHVGMQPPTAASNALYVDPSIFSKRDYDLIVRFVQSNFKEPIGNNKLVKWLDDDVLGASPDKPYHTIYAIVYQKMSAFEKVYLAPDGLDHFTIRVDNNMSVSETVDGLAMESLYEYSVRNDTLFYPAYETEDRVKRMLNFTDKDGITFAEIAKVLMPVVPK
jgi:hypothetical protein